MPSVANFDQSMSYAFDVLPRRRELMIPSSSRWTRIAQPCGRSGQWPRPCWPAWGRFRRGPRSTPGNKAALGRCAVRCAVISGRAVCTRSYVHGANQVAASCFAASHAELVLVVARLPASRHGASPPRFRGRGSGRRPRIAIRDSPSGRCGRCGWPAGSCPPGRRDAARLALMPSRAPPGPRSEAGRLRRPALMVPTPCRQLKRGGDRTNGGLTACRDLPSFCRVADFLPSFQPMASQ